MTTTDNPSYPKASRKSLVAGPVVTLLLALAPALAPAQSANPAPITGDTIAGLEAELQSNAQEESLVARRRNLKNVIRQAQAQLRDAPETPQRYALLDIILTAQERLLAMDNNERNREALFETCQLLAKAPDAYAKLRLDADLLLSERDLSNRDATPAERATALEALIARYRDTPAEAKSLCMAARIVTKLDARALEKAIQDRLDAYFPDDLEVIAARRKYLLDGARENTHGRRLYFSFTGRFKRADGTELSFPADTSGHMCLMVFWSRHKSGIDTYLETLHTAITNEPAPISVFSFNVDDLPDSGASLLRDKGLGWTVMQLPGGQANQAYQAYAQGDPTALLVNEYGFAVVRPEIVHSQVAKANPAHLPPDTFVDGGAFAPFRGVAQVPDERLSDARYSAQFLSLIIGDFLVWDQRPASSDAQLESKWAAIQACFPPAPFRYRLKPEEALANYRKAEALCAKVIKALPESPDLWRIRNGRIIALLGMWNLEHEPAHLKQAVEEAQIALNSRSSRGNPTPRFADPSQEGNSPASIVIPRFCLAKAALREPDANPERVIEQFLADCGGAKAPPSALAAACVLAIEPTSRKLHRTYREAFLAAHADHPGLDAFISVWRFELHGQATIHIPCPWVTDGTAVEVSCFYPDTPTVPFQWDGKKKELVVNMNKERSPRIFRLKELHNSPATP